MRWLVLAVFFVCTSCLTRDERISEFQIELGLEKAKALNALVAHFELQLNGIYPSQPLEKAYLALFKDLESGNFSAHQKLKVLPESLEEVYEESGLHADVHQENHQPLKINEDGIFFKMMRSQSYYNELISEYLWVLEEVGPINDAPFASGMLKFNFNPKNYFHKRLVVFQFLP